MKEIDTLKMKIDECRSTWKQKSQITGQERDYYVKQTDALNQEWVRISKEKEFKS